MKKLFLICSILLIAFFTKAQNNVGIGTASPNSSSILDLTSTTKGFLMPRMTSAERILVTAPTTGLLVFDTDTKTIWAFDGALWKNLNTAGGSFTLPYAGVDASATSFKVTNNLSTGTAIEGVSSTVAGTAIKGTNTLGVAIRGTNSSNNSSVAAISGESTASNGLGVEGTANGSNTNSIGVYGEAASGTAVKGYSNNVGSTAVFGSSLAGTGVKAYSFTGKALEVIGNLQISGGNTNPSQGALLTSDATGNAVWKTRNVGFNAQHTTSWANVAENTNTTMFLNLETFDSGNDFNLQSAALDPSTFIVPVTGVYHFSASVTIFLSSAVYNLSGSSLFLWKNGNSIISDYTSVSSNNLGSSSIPLSIDGTFRLAAGDKIKAVVNQTNGGGLTAIQIEPIFSGHLVYAD